METSERTPRGGVHAPDLEKVVRAKGPFLTLYLDTDPAIEQAAQRSETRWKTLRRDLEGSGMPDRLGAEIDAMVPRAHLEG
ncbi:MAG: hypothetical protein M3245_04545, partial [Actinomycetota bacterium]|nr:hypothetical protein [Actinomycetota bacterium]